MLQSNYENFNHLLFDFVLLFAFVDLEFSADVGMFSFENVNSVSWLIILLLILVDLILSQFDFLFEVSLLVVEFILERQEMLIERNTVAE